MLLANTKREPRCELTKPQLGSNPVSAVGTFGFGRQHHAELEALREPTAADPLGGDSSIGGLFLGSRWERLSIFASS
jgi:hypothetical protein